MANKAVYVIDAEFRVFSVWVKNVDGQLVFSDGWKFVVNSLHLKVGTFLIFCPAQYHEHAFEFKAFQRSFEYRDFYFPTIFTNEIAAEMVKLQLIELFYFFC